MASSSPSRITTTPTALTLTTKATAHHTFFSNPDATMLSVIIIAAVTLVLVVVIISAAVVVSHSINRRKKELRARRLAHARLLQEARIDALHIKREASDNVQVIVAHNTPFDEYRMLSRDRDRNGDGDHDQGLGLSPFTVEFLHDAEYRKEMPYAYPKQHRQQQQQQQKQPHQPEQQQQHQQQYQQHQPRQHQHHRHHRPHHHHQQQPGHPPKGLHSSPPLSPNVLSPSPTISTIPTNTHKVARGVGVGGVDRPLLVKPLSLVDRFVMKEKEHQLLTIVDRFVADQAELGAHHDHNNSDSATSESGVEIDDNFEDSDVDDEFY